MITVSATDLKNRTSEILNDVYYGKKDVIVKKHGKSVAKIVPVGEQFDTDKSIFLQILEKTRGSWASDDWEKTTKRREKIELQASKKRKQAW